MSARKGFLILFATMACFGLTCCVIPHALFFAACGRLPLKRGQDPFKIPVGTTSDEVRASLGPPHDLVKHEDGREVWYYHGDVFGINIYGMEFDADGHLVNVWS